MSCSSWIASSTPTTSLKRFGEPTTGCTSVENPSPLGSPRALSSTRLYRIEPRIPARASERSNFHTCALGDSCHWTCSGCSAVPREPPPPMALAPPSAEATPSREPEMWVAEFESCASERRDSWFVAASARMYSFTTGSSLAKLPLSKRWIAMCGCFCEMHACMKASCRAVSVGMRLASSSSWRSRRTPIESSDICLSPILLSQTGGTRALYDVMHLAGNSGSLCDRNGLAASANRIAKTQAEPVAI
mmetsp:Transcript_21264/g.48886  ORF Transcript_21264/g.48886 Transcript_21264/m.48886 type:complete len:247 (-) Transcript_21264:32-772(-)